MEERYERTYQMEHLAEKAHKEAERLKDKLNAAEAMRQSGARGLTILESRAIIENIYRTPNNKTP